MKTTAMLLAVMVIATTINAQDSKSKSETTKITNDTEVKLQWKEVAFMLPENYWDSAKIREIIAQIGAKEFKRVRENSHYSKIPQQMWNNYAMSAKVVDWSEYQKKNDQLKVYKIASYHHWWGGKYWGIYDIIMVPYSGNESFDSKARWDTVYFIIPEKFVTAAQNTEGNQEVSKIPNNTEVKLHWMETSLMFPESYWYDNKKAELVKQLGEQEFEKVKVYSHYQKIPNELSIINLSTHMGKDLNSYQAKMDQLKVTKIASYHHWWNGKYWGIYDIIRVPYKNNENFDSAAKWDTVYFVIPEKFVTKAN